ncbi:MAG: hypothetical protein Kow0026_01980 [Oricola sp.]
MSAAAPHGLHRGELASVENVDSETARLLGDYMAVASSVHQHMPISGPWFEERIRSLLVPRLPAGWFVSGPSQVFDPARPELRTRSWDLVVHRVPDGDLPPPASANSGYPLLPKAAVAAVIDTKTMFADVARYCTQTAFDIRNSCELPQFDLLGRSVTKIVLAASSPTSAATLFVQGRDHGAHVFSLSRFYAGPVSDYEQREWRLTPERLAEGWPLQLFHECVALAVARHREMAGVS